MVGRITISSKNIQSERGSCGSTPKTIAKGSVAGTRMFPNRLLLGSIIDERFCR